MHVAPLARSDFPAETLAALAQGRKLAFDGQGLVRVPETGELRLDADFDPELLRHVTMLKLSDEEAEVLGDPAALPVPEVLVTHGSHGSTLYIEGRAEKVPAFPLPAEPTGAGDAFSISYVAARSIGLVAARGRRLRDGGRRRRARRRVIALVATAAGIFGVDLDSEEVAARRAVRARARAALNLPRVVAAAEAGSTVVAVVDAKPPMLVSHDAGLTWRESGRGLPPGTGRRDRRPTTPTRSSTRRGTGSTSRATAASSGRRSRSSCPRSRRSRVREC